MMPWALRREAVGFIFLGLALGAAGGFLAWHHPLGAELALVVYGALMAFGFRFPALSLPLIAACLPVVDLAPWSGWIVFEEFDLLVLALVSGSLFGWALARNHGKLRDAAEPRGATAAVVLITIFALVVLLGMARGFSDAGGFEFGWYQGYLEPMNSLRLAKSYFFALLLLPIWFHAYRQHPERAARWLAGGMATGLGLASLAALWERLAFTGLLDFSADYRTTALFWEMHVGGAAFDGYLALVLPFAVWMLMQSRSWGSLMFFGGILVLAGYAALTTFSRVVYVAVPAALLTFAVMVMRQSRSFHRQSLARLFVDQRAVFFRMGLMGVFFALAAYWIFPTSGYRGLLALVVAFALLQPVAAVLGASSRQSARRALAFAGGVAALAWPLAWWLPKGVYWVFAAGAAVTVASLSLGRDADPNRKSAGLLAGYVVLAGAAVLIAAHWGGRDAAWSMGWVVLVLLLALTGGLIGAWRPVSAQGQASFVGLLLTISVGVATFGGGAYMGSRFGSSGQDFAGRMQHWTSGVAQIDGMDWWLGNGLGRYPASHFFAIPFSEHPGGYRLEAAEEASHLLLSGGNHVNGPGEIFRVTQRLAPGPMPYSVSFDALADKPVRLHFEICEKHLLYNGACVAGAASVAAGSAWQSLTLNLVGDAPSRGAWYAPRLVAFSVAVESRGGSVKLDNLAVRDGSGNNVLLNGDFSDGLAHWFSSSDRHHLPWHIKSLFLNVLLDSGLVGLTLFLAMIYLAIHRMARSGARLHPLAPALVAGLCGMLVVGIFDSLLDVPRLAVLFYFLLMLGMLSGGLTPFRPRQPLRHYPASMQGI